jgi:hypothetical protein
MQGKIIGIGFHKTGTSTLREALKLLGYKVKDTTPRALIPILRGRYNKVLRIIKNYDALEDTPWYFIYKELDVRIPHSKFILTIRDSESWYTSVSKHIGDLKSAQHEWIYGRGKGLPKDDKQNTISVFERHNSEVRKYFKNRPDDFLEIDFTKGEGWEKLCSFLQKDIPDQAFLHYHKTSEVELRKNTPKSRIRKLRQRIKNNFKICCISLMGWWQ